MAALMHPPSPPFPDVRRTRKTNGTTVQKRLPQGQHIAARRISHHARSKRTLTGRTPTEDYISSMLAAASTTPAAPAAARAAPLAPYGGRTTTASLPLDPAGALPSDSL